jgi:hypothetical protein
VFVATLGAQPVKSGNAAQTQSTITYLPGPAAKLAFTQPPSNSTGGIAFGTQPQVTVQDANGNTVTGDTSSVTLAVGTNPSGGTLSCTANPLSASAGVATFAGCKIDKSGNGYTLIATDGSLTSATSSTFNITVGPAAQLVFTQQPSNSTPGTAFATQPVVTIEDAGGNTVSDTGTVALAIGINPGGGTLTCTNNTVNAVAGVATFASCRINNAGTGYTLTASRAGLTQAVSSPFSIAAAVTYGAPVIANKTGGTAGKPETGDTITVTYTGSLAVNTVCGAWSGDGSNQAVSDVSVILSNNAVSSHDGILSTGLTSATCGTIRFGTIDTGGVNYVTADVTFTNSTLAWDATAHTLKITLGTASGATGTDTNPNKPSYTASTGITGSSGVQISTATQQGNNAAQF